MFFKKFCVQNFLKTQPQNRARERARSRTRKACVQAKFLKIKKINLKMPTPDLQNPITLSPRSSAKAVGD